MGTDQTTPSLPQEVQRFFSCIFDGEDNILIRPVETWTETGRKKSRVVYKEIRYRRVKDLLNVASLWHLMLTMAEKERANLFFGVCPRFTGNSNFDRAFQIRTVRVLWSDLDNCNSDEALQRCQAAGLPTPTVVIASGHGVHLYWVLAEPIAIDDVGDPLPIHKEFVNHGEGQKKKVRSYVLVNNERVYEFLPDAKGGDSRRKNPEFPKLSAKAIWVQDILHGIADKIGGDHTFDLSRILRLPATLNRKNQRNGQTPTPCTLVDCDPKRPYPLALFEKFLQESPTKIEREKVAQVKLPPAKKVTPGRLQGLTEYINRSAILDVGQRSGADYSLCCYAISKGLDKEDVWGHVSGTGKFAERGREYFDLTWGNAEDDVRQSIYDRLTRSAAKSRPGSNGHGEKNGDNSVNHGPHTAAGEDDEPEDDSDTLAEAPDDPHRLARIYLAETATHPDGVPLLRYCREEFHRYTGTHWKPVPDADLRAELAHFTKGQFNKDIELILQMWDGKGATPVAPMVTKVLISNVIQALAGEVLLPHDTMVGVWISDNGTKKQNYLALTNGLLDIDAYLNKDDDILRPHSPRWFSPVCLPYEYDPRADCPIWRGFLGRNLAGDLGKIALLRHWFGLLLVNDTSFQRFLMMVGEGANGKSVVCAVIEAVLGEQNIAAVPLELFGEKFHLIETEGKLANVVAEVGELDKVAEGVLKAFVTGDAILFEKKFKRPYRAKPTARLVLATNNPPQFSDKSDGIWRRVLLLTFSVQIPESEQTAGMDKAEWWGAQGELPGLLNWSLAGLAELRAQGRFVLPEAAKNDVAKLRNDSNPARRYLLEHYEAAPNDSLRCAEVYSEYAAWCLEHGCFKLGDVGFGREVARVFKAVKRARASRPEMNDKGQFTRPWLYRGLGRKDLAAPDDEAPAH